MSALALPVANYSEEYIVTFGDVEVNLDRTTVRRNGVRINLSPSEFDLLTCFLQNPERTLSRDMLLESVWSGLRDPSTRTVDAHVMRLRRKLEGDPAKPRHFVTMHRSGYLFSPAGFRPAGSREE